MKTMNNKIGINHVACGIRFGSGYTILYGELVEITRKNNARTTGFLDATTADSSGEVLILNSGSPKGTIDIIVISEIAQIRLYSDSETANKIRGLLPIWKASQEADMLKSMESAIELSEKSGKVRPE